MREVAEHVCDFGLLRRLLVDPFAHDLLFGAHLADELVHTAREIAHMIVRSGPRNTAERAGVAALETLRKILDRALHLKHRGKELAARLFGDAGGARRQLGDTGQPFLELVIEAVVSMAGLQLEEAENERAGETQQR